MADHGKEVRDGDSSITGDRIIGRRELRSVADGAHAAAPPEQESTGGAWSFVQSQKDDYNALRAENGILRAKLDQYQNAPEACKILIAAKQDAQFKGSDDAVDQVPNHLFLSVVRSFLVHLQILSDVTRGFKATGKWINVTDLGKLISDLTLVVRSTDLIDLLYFDAYFLPYVDLAHD